MKEKRSRRAARVRRGCGCQITAHQAGEEHKLPKVLHPSRPRRLHQRRRVVCRRLHCDVRRAAGRQSL